MDDAKPIAQEPPAHASASGFSHLPSALAGGPGVAQVFSLAVHANNQALIRKISKDRDLGAFVLILSAIAMLFQRYDEQKTQVLHIPELASSDSPGVLPIRLDITPAQSLREVILATRDGVTEAYASEGHTAPARPQSAQSEDGELRVLVSHSSLHPALGGTAFGLRVQIDGEDGTLQIEDDHGLIPRALRATMTDHLNTLIAEFGEPEQSNADLPFLSTEETAKLTEEFNATQDDALATLPTLPTLFEELVQTAPEHLALVVEGRETTRAALDAQAAAVAHHLGKDLGIRPGQAVAALCDRSENAVIAILGILKLGCIYVPLSDKYPPARIMRQIADTDAKAVLCHSRYLDVISEACAVPILALDLQLSTLTPPPHPVTRDISPDYTAAIVFTSGSEGQPKGIPITHRGLVNVAMDHVALLQITPQDRYLHFMALAFDGALLDIFTGLLSDAVLVMTPDEVLSDIDRFHSYIETHGVTMFTMTPSYLALLDRQRLQNVRAIISAAEPARAEDAAFHSKVRDFYNGYGPSEASVNTTLHKARPDGPARQVPVGRPRANKQVYILDRYQRLKPLGTVGEIAISGVGLTKGYLNDPDLTAQKFIPHPFRAGERLYLSGDMGYWDEDGAIWLIGRKDQQIKLRGFRIELGEVEQNLLANPTVIDAAAVFDPITTRIFAFVRSDTPLATEALQEDLRAHLPEYMIPSALAQVEALPINSNGKVDRKVLLDWAANLPQLTVASTPQSETERKLDGIWQTVLQRDEIRVDADFFQLGGDSLRLVQMVHLARKEGLLIDAASVMRHPTIQKLAGFLSEGSAPSHEHSAIEMALAELSPEERADLPKDNVDAAYPATRMQELMLRRYCDPHWQALGTYHCIASWRLKEQSILLSAMEMAVGKVMRRQPSLRTVFLRSPSSGRLLQVVRSATAVPFQTHDFREMSPQEAEAALAALKSNECTAPFNPGDLDTPLLRFLLALLPDGSSVLIMAICHAIIDGWSAVEMENDIFGSYQKLIDGQALDAPEAAAHLTLEQFSALEQQVVENVQSAAYWQHAIEDLAPPMSKADPADPGAAGYGVVEHALEPTLFPKLEALMGTEKASLKAVCLTIFLRALHKLFEREAVSVGVLVNGRSEHLSNPLRSVGLFWNVVPFTSRGTPAISAIHENLSMNEAHSRYPLAKLCDMAGQEALFDICFNFVQFHNAYPHENDLGEIAFDAVDRLHFPMTFLVSAERRGDVQHIDLRVDFNRAHFSASDAEALMTAFEAKAADIQPLEEAEP